MNKVVQTIAAIIGVIVVFSLIAAQCSDTAAVKEQRDALEEYSPTN